MATHLAIFTAGEAERIFSGRKKIEGRFSQIKIPPFGKVSAGDRVLIKISGEKVVGEFLVDRILSFDHPKKEELLTLRKKYFTELAFKDDFWLEHERVNYVTLMFIRSVNKFIVAPQIKKRDLRSWVVLS